MLVDTDVLIWNLRGNSTAAEKLDEMVGFAISAVSYMELVQGLRNKQELHQLRQAMRYWEAELVHLDEGMSARAAFLVESYALSHSMQMADALIAATAMELGLPLLTANDRHYRHIDGLEIEVFRPIRNEGGG
ncbi:type II toxin-antitoxin system VapC family toxin [Halomonas sp. ML-15]|uniref:type II toxin-antitoxin system VapC family toxin n=1 Tax=Halomonas sp. ML-15 TaxID=2773305 RepID=UPI001746B516|nr:type II toxin-antitoxin system VapC family toxin [Halomonas sp. ML-15]MBD3894525.1 type II toxin-antitoxin system VapC family toxin [Halomonas sp. ML-15]